MPNKTAVYSLVRLTRSLTDREHCRTPQLSPVVRQLPLVQESLTEQVLSSLVGDPRCQRRTARAERLGLFPRFFVAHLQLVPLRRSQPAQHRAVLALELLTVPVRDRDRGIDRSRPGGRRPATNGEPGPCGPGSLYTSLLERQAYLYSVLIRPQLRSSTGTVAI